MFRSKVISISMGGMVMLLTFLTMARGLSAPTYSAWSPVASFETIPGTSSELNSPSLDGCPIFSRDGQSLYLASNRLGGRGGIDIWQSSRASNTDPFGAPFLIDGVEAVINSSFNDFCPSPMRDGHGFLFVSNRPGGCGENTADIYMTRYNPETGWEDPVNLGCDVNSPAEEAGPMVVYAESGPPTLYFSSTRSGNGDLYMSQMTGDRDFGPAVLVPGDNLNTSAVEVQPYVSQDGRELYFSSDRDGSIGGADIWVASRASNSDVWSTPVNPGMNINSAASESRPSLSWDGTMLLFGSNRPGVEGASDIFFSTRVKNPTP